MLPEGEYLMKVVDGKRKQNSKGNGDHLEVTFMVLDSQYGGEPEIKDRFNLWHESDRAKVAAKHALEELQDAAAVADRGHFAPLKGRLVVGTVVHKDGFANIAGYRPESHDPMPQDIYFP